MRAVVMPSSCAHGYAPMQGPSSAEPRARVTDHSPAGPPKTPNRNDQQPGPGVDIRNAVTRLPAVGLLPKNELFFDDFDKHTALIVSAAELLATMTARNGDAAADAKRMKELEEQGDAITHRVALGLRRAFVTPLDRDDTYNLMAHLDDVLDLIEATADRVALFKLRLPQPHLSELVD